MAPFVGKNNISFTLKQTLALWVMEWIPDYPNTWEQVHQPRSYTWWNKPTMSIVVCWIPPKIKLCFLASPMLITSRKPRPCSLWNDLPILSEPKGKITVLLSTDQNFCRLTWQTSRTTWSGYLWKTWRLSAQCSWYWLNESKPKKSWATTSQLA